MLLLALYGQLLLRVHLRRRLLRAAATRAILLVLRCGRRIVLAAAGDNSLILAAVEVQLVVAADTLIARGHGIQLAKVASIA